MSQVSIDYGRYNLLSNEKEWCVQVLLPNGKWLSQTFREQPEVDSTTLPSEAVEIIAERIKSLWISTSREEKLKQVEYARQRAPEMDKQWAERKINVYQQSIDRLRKIVTSCEQDIAERENVDG